METTQQNKLNMSDLDLKELTESEVVLVEGGGFWKDIGKFLGAWGNFVNDYSSDGSNPVVLMGGA